jgi:lipoprotein-releasing system permease protein
LRYLKSRLSAVAALLAVLFGVAVILIVLSIMGGYIETLKETIRGQESHLTVLGPGPFAVAPVAEIEEAIRRVPGVQATSPFIETLAMYRSGQFNPCHLRGVVPASQVEVSDLGRYIFRPEALEDLLREAQGAAADEADAEPDGTAAPRAELGTSLLTAERTSMSPSEVESLFSKERCRALLEKLNPATLAALGGEVPPAVIVGVHFLLENQVYLGQVLPIVAVHPRRGEPTVEWFVVAGAFRTGDYESDSKAMYAHADVLKNTLDLFDPEHNAYRFEGIRVALQDPSRLDEMAVAVERALLVDHPSLMVRTWEMQRPTLLRAVKIEKFVIYFLLVLLMGFTGCMVLLMLLLTVIEKTRDMGILLALGATPGGVVRIFLANGLLISLAGTLLGMGAGYLFCLNINPIHDWIARATSLELFPAKIYKMDRIPIDFQLTDVLLSIAPPLLLGFLASLIPSVWASRRDPIKAIHYE